MQRHRSESATSVAVLTPPLLPLPSTAYELEESVHRARPEKPERVAAFLLHVPRNLPWRYQESEAERSERQALETLGGWTG